MTATQQRITPLLRLSPIITKSFNKIVRLWCVQNALPSRVVIMSIQRTESSIYQSYLLRFSYDQAARSWRTTVQSTTTQTVYHFATLDAAWTFLTALLTAASVGRNQLASDAYQEEERPDRVMC